MRNTAARCFPSTNKAAARCFPSKRGWPGWDAPHRHCDTQRMRCASPCLPTHGGELSPVGDDSRLTSIRLGLAACMRCALIPMCCQPGLPQLRKKPGAEGGGSKFWC